MRHVAKFSEAPPCYVPPSLLCTWRCPHVHEVRTKTIRPSWRGSSSPPPDRPVFSRCTPLASTRGRRSRCRPRTVCPCTWLAFSPCGYASPSTLSNLGEDMDGLTLVKLFFIRRKRYLLRRCRIVPHGTEGNHSNRSSFPIRNRLKFE